MPRRSKRINAVPVRGGWDILPHNMGVLPTTSAQPVTTAAPIATPTTLPTTQPTPTAAGIDKDNHDEQLNEIAGDDGEVDKTSFQEQGLQDVAPFGRPKRKTTKLMGNGDDDLTNHPEPKRLKRATRSTRKRATDSIAVLQLEENQDRVSKAEAGDQDLEQPKPPKKAKRAPKKDKDEDYNLAQEAQPMRPKRIRKQVKSEEIGVNLEDLPKKPKRVPRKTKDNPYGLTPGTTPFPDWQAPSADQCQEVYRILADMHDDVQPQAPEIIPAPSLEVTGCGEVPFVLEALVRTLLSGAVTFAGAAKMLQGIVRKYGTLTDGVAKGSIDWNKVRLSSVEDLIDAIREGGLARIKAKSIKGILDMVYQESIERREAYLAERETGISANVFGASEKTRSQKDLEILKTEQNILSLDHMRGLSANEAMRQFTKYPGVGVKTAACVILFCLQRPCFAVDTHVHKFSRWLGWAPAKADENDVFSHLEVRCPDHLKYGLHQLFIRHGQTCGRCKKVTAEGTKEWNAIVCPLEHLLVRSGKRQTTAKPKPPKRAKKTSSLDDNAERETQEGNGEDTNDKLVVRDEIEQQDPGGQNAIEGQGYDDDLQSELSEIDSEQLDDMDYED
ncbi:DNA glycosylase [Xylariaceae sp. FL1651]|nr:DNA glycosylase [Xylariaceae sp. FL1651]